jgi:hypothetical protein
LEGRTVRPRKDIVIPQDSFWRSFGCILLECAGLSDIEHTPSSELIKTTEELNIVADSLGVLIMAIADQYNDARAWDLCWWWTGNFTPNKSRAKTPRTFKPTQVFQQYVPQEFIENPLTMEMFYVRVKSNVNVYDLRKMGETGLTEFVLLSSEKADIREEKK